MICPDVKAPAALRQYRSGRYDLGGEQTWRPEHYEISAASKDHPTRSRDSWDRRGKPTHSVLGKADDIVEETGESTRCNALRGDGPHLPNEGNTEVGQRGSGHLAASLAAGGRLDKTGVSR